MNIVDKIFPWFVGNRTQILGLVLAGLKLASAFGGIPPQVVDGVTSVVVPLMSATFAAKFNRNGGNDAKPSQTP